MTMESQMPIRGMPMILAVRQAIQGGANHKRYFE